MEEAKTEKQNKWVIDSGYVYQTRYNPDTKGYIAETRWWADFIYRPGRYWSEWREIGERQTREEAERLCDEYAQTLPHVREYVPKTSGEG